MPPIPKRSDELIRRNKPDTPVDRIDMDGAVEIPPLELDNCHPMINEFYEALKKSGQTRFYEPSDWQMARIVCHFLNREIKTVKPSGMMLSTLFSQLTSLLVTEGDRRRLRMEVTREGRGDQPDAKVIDIGEMFRQRMENAG